MIAHRLEAASGPARPLKIGGANWYAAMEMQDRRGVALQDCSVLEGCVGLQECVVTDAIDTGPDLQEVLTANYGHLHRRLTRYLGCADLASDSLHDTWLRLAEKERGLERGRERERDRIVQNPQAYLYRAACNAAMDRLDAQKRHQGEVDFDLQMEVTADAAPGPEAIAEACSDLRAMARVFAGLPKLQQCVLYALRIDERPRQEVAQQYGISLRCVDRSLARALAYCAGKMEEGSQA
jgi:RNA polymerase sigma factor (sigma-70 family)